MVMLTACGGSTKKASAASGSGSDSTPTAPIVVNAPFSAQPFIANEIAHGAELAVDEVNRAGGIRVGRQRLHLQVRRMDNRSSPTTAADNVSKAAEAGALAVVDEGTGIDASAPLAAKAGLPVGIVFQGGTGLVDRATKPAVFRIAPTDRGVAFRLAEYLVPKNLRIAIVHDDSEFGANGSSALDKAFSSNRSSLTTTLTIAASGGDPAPQVLEARRSGATALLVWARPAGVAAVLRSARSAGWSVPVYTPTSGEDPVVRQQLSDHPEWVDGLTFTSSRLTSEKGPAPFEAFRSSYEAKFGPDLVGVSSQGQQVVQPPDFPMYAYDFVHVVAAAVARAAVTKPGPTLIDAMERVEVTGANGDDRSFNERNHEGVVDDDIFFASFHDMVWSPVKDDALSATLPPIPQLK